MDGVTTNKEFGDFVKDLKKSKKNRYINIDEIVGYTRENVEKEIMIENLLTKEQFEELVEEFKKARKERIRNDRLCDGIVESMVMDHSEPNGCCMENEYQVHEIAEKMITPSFGEPGQCFPLDGDNGFVEIRLRDIIVVVFLTLEHVAKVIFDDDKKFLSTEFTYDLKKKNVLTYKVVELAASKLVDTST
ncbi:hypothetical protein ACJIZ3_023847 [Penstemon smallii]|uniref:SUN domain-containing protein n=1 Tax=Penstemon smallii TaxID=265156 RepID=A0ABD3TQ67_9LAMI